MLWLLKFLVYISCALSVFSDELVENVIVESEIDRSLSENIVLYGIISELATQKTSISVTCAGDLTKTFRGINQRDMWAIKAMDASGTYLTDFIWGQNGWIGSKRNCEYLNDPPRFTVSPDIPKQMDEHLISTISPMEMELKLIFLTVISPYKVDPLIYGVSPNIHRIGLCLPKSCSNQDIEILSKNFFTQPKLQFQKMYNVTAEVINVRSMDIDNFLSQPEVSGIIIALCIAVALVVLFSCANKFVNNTNSVEVSRFLKCFSIHDNVASIYNTSSSPNSINSINGLRTVICLWVLLIHCGYFTMYNYDNLPAVMAALERIAIQPFFAIIFYVDAFFVLSALLLVYNFLKDDRTLTEVRNNSHMGNVKLFLKKIVHRYIRLTPAFVFTLAISHLVSIYIRESSAFHIHEKFDSYCSPKDFLHSVFYIHNLYKVKDMCTAWSWYLACDMQFYVIVLFILIVHARNPAIAKTIFVALFAAITAFGIYKNVENNILPRLDSLFYHLDDFYIEPWNRMHPYLGGCTMGYIMFLMKDKKFPDNRYITISYWTVTTAIIFATFFLTYMKESSCLSFVLALSFGRYFLGIFVGSIILMCHFGYGGVINKVLASRFFVHFNKVTYSMYLLHPVIIMLFNSNEESSPHFDVPSIAVYVFGIMLLSYVAAVIMSPIIEIPFQKLSDEYVMRKSKTKK